MIKERSKARVDLKSTNLVKEVNNNMKQRIEIIVTISYFLFVSSHNASNFYYQDTEGFKRFMAIEGMAKSDAAFNIAEYLEWFLSNKAEKEV